MHLRKSLTKVKVCSVSNFYTEEKKRELENSNVKIGNSLSYFLAGKFLGAIELVKKSFQRVFENQVNLQ